MARDDREAASAKFRRWVLAVFAAALLLRLIFLLQFSGTPLFDTPVMDPAYHHEWAQHVAAGTAFVEGPFFRAPLYPYLLGAVYFLCGDGAWAPRIAQVILGSLSAVLVSLIGMRVFNRKTGIIAGFLTAVSGTLIFYDGQLLIPTLAIFLDLAAIYFLSRARRRRHWHQYSAAGLALGLSAIARPTIVLFGLAIWFWLIWDQRRLSLNLAAYSVALILPIIPVTIHNYAASGEFVPIATYGGLNFYIGNNLEADGVTAKIPGARQDWWGMMEDAEAIAVRESGRRLSAAEQSDFWLKKGIAEIVERPLRFARHLGRKTLLLFFGYELSNNFDLYFFAHQAPLLRILMWRSGFYFPWGIILPLSLCGMMLARRRKREHTILLLFLCCYAVAVVLFFVTARYRLPLLPILTIFAARGITEFPRNLKDALTGQRRLAIAILLLALIAANVDFVGYSGRSSGQGWHALASIHSQRGDIDRAIEYYGKALEADPGLVPAANDLATLLMQRGHLDQAKNLLGGSLEAQPDNRIVQLNLAACYQQLGRVDSARFYLRSVLTAEPGNLPALRSLAMSYASAQDYDSARHYFKRTLMLEPNSSSVSYNIGLTFSEQGEVDSAIAYYRQALDWDSSFSQASFNLGYVYLDLGDTAAAIREFDLFLKHWQSGAQEAEQVRNLLDALQKRQ